MKQIYDIPAKLPKVLIINGLKVNFMSFQQIGQMLQNNQIERFILDLLLQAWGGKPNSTNKILTIF